MSDHRDRDETDLQRRDVLRAAGIAIIGGLAASAAATRAAAQSVPRTTTAASNNGPLGARLQGVQHFGLTVQNMDRAFEFYTEVLGGTEVMRDGDFYGERIHNTLLTDQEIEARASGQSAHIERLAAPIEANSNGITEGQSNGWRLIYCKGSEGEQLEFVQALGPVKHIFDSTREARQKAVGG